MDKVKLYAIVEKNSNRAIALVDETLISSIKKTLPIFDTVVVVNTGVTSFRSDFGTINAISLITDEFSGSDYYMIKDYPDSITLAKAYELIAVKK